MGKRELLADVIILFKRLSLQGISSGLKVESFEKRLIAFWYICSESLSLFMYVCKAGKKTPKSMQRDEYSSTYFSVKGIRVPK